MLLSSNIDVVGDGQGGDHERMAGAVECQLIAGLFRDRRLIPSLPKRLCH